MPQGVSGEPEELENLNDTGAIAAGDRGRS
jgi:hypothetical protein